jgi:hypothetical protein
MLTRVFALTFLLAATSGVSLAQTDTETFNVTSPIRVLGTELGSQVNDTTEPYKSGQITAANAKAMLDALKVATDRVTIIHILRWGDAGHKTLKFQNWYLYNPVASRTTFYVKSKKQMFEDNNIPGVKNFRLVYIHLNFDLNNPSESISTTADGTALVHPVSYKIVITKEPTQFVQDFKTVLQIVGGGTATAGESAKPGYWSVSEFSSAYQTSSLTITPSLNQKTSDTIQGKTSDEASKVSTLTPKTYANEKPSYLGLSFAVPVTSYKDVVYQSTGSTLAPKTITQQNIYLNLDLYYPPAQPGLMAFRYLPHPFIGLPIKGKVLDHTMLGLAFGLPWFEPYAGLVFDLQNGTTPDTSQRLTLKGTFGFKVSVSAIAKAVKKTTNNSKSST